MLTDSKIRSLSLSDLLAHIDWARKQINILFETRNNILRQKRDQSYWNSFLDIMKGIFVSEEDYNPRINDAIDYLQVVEDILKEKNRRYYFTEHHHVFFLRPEVKNKPVHLTKKRRHDLELEANLINQLNGTQALAPFVMAVSINPPPFINRS